MSSCGVRMMNEENYLEIREVALNRLRRKAIVSSFILEKVEEMKNESSTSVGKETDEVEDAPW